MPTIISARNKVKETHVKNTLSEGFKDAIDRELKHRFDWLLSPLDASARDALFAAVSHSYFRLRFLPVGLRQVVKDMFLAAVKEYALNSPTSEESEAALNLDSTTLNSKDDFYHFDEDDVASSNQTSIDIEVMKYFDDTCSNISWLEMYSNVKKYFIKMNTPLPSSAPV